MQHTLICVTEGLQDQIEELKSKLSLKERNFEAFIESANALKRKNKDLIKDLSTQNNEKRRSLVESLNADMGVIRNVFADRKDDCLAMERLTADDAISSMAQKVCKVGGKLNTLRYQSKKLEDTIRLRELELQQEKLKSSSNKEVHLQQRYRMLQNNIDKAKVKYQSATSICRTFQKILEHMQEECRHFPGRLNTLEVQATETRAELKELKEINVEATKNCDAANAKMKVLERELYSKKKEQEKHLSRVRKDVKRRQIEMERLEKRPRVNMIGDNSETKFSRMRAIRACRREKMVMLNKVVEEIKKVINVSDIQDVVIRLANQEHTRRCLEQQRNNLTTDIVNLKEERKVKAGHYDELMAANQRKADKSTKLVNDMEMFTDGEERRELDASELMEKREILLEQVQTAIGTLFDKLKEIKLKPPFQNFSKCDPVEDLGKCEKKLIELLDIIGIAKEGEDQRVVDKQKLHEYLELNLPPENMRVNVNDTESDFDDFAYEFAQDNDGLLTREEIKVMALELQDTKLKPKKRVKPKGKK